MLVKGHINQSDMYNINQGFKEYCVINQILATVVINKSTLKKKKEESSFSQRSFQLISVAYHSYQLHEQASLMILTPHKSYTVIQQNPEHKLCVYAISDRILYNESTVQLLLVCI